MIEIVTERLEITEFSAYDTAFIVELLNSKGWLQYIGDRGVRNAHDAVAYLINGPMRSYNEKGFGLWRVSLKDTNEPIGMCGLLQRDYLQHLDIGFALLPEYEGKGYAYEAAEAVLQFAVKELKAATVAAITMPDNEHSLRLLQRLGFEDKGMIQVPGGGEELVLLEKRMDK
jgi:RimJ/RimL family protein N-acetyltransferase